MHVNTDENSDQCNDRTSGFSDISNCILSITFKYHYIYNN